MTRPHICPLLVAAPWCLEVVPAGVNWASGRGLMGAHSHARPLSTSEPRASTSHEKMASDKRYRAVNEVPDAVLSSMHSDTPLSEFSIKDEAREGMPVYLDFQSTTPLDPRVLDAMLPTYTEQFGNPHSRTHVFGWDAEALVEQGREQVADLIGAKAKEVIFTSGATESNNLALKGIPRFYRSSGKNHIITTQTEHKCVLDSCRWLEMEGFEVSYLPVQSNGLLDLNLLAETIRPETVLVSVMGANNEIGVVQPLKEIGAMCRKHKGLFFHSDCAQMLGKLPIDVDELNIDVMSMSGHKIYGPKGIGALYVRRKPRVRMEALISGGGQERGLRSGTLPHPLCVGFGKACEVAKAEMANDHEWTAYLADKLITGIQSRVDEVILNGDAEHRLPGNVNLSFAFIEGESMLMALKNIAVSSGSACTSESLEPSYVLRAIGVEEDLAHTSIRFGIGRFTTEEEIDLTIELAVKHATRLREMSPLWEMHQAGIDLKTIQWTQEH